MHIADATVENLCAEVRAVRGRFVRRVLRVSISIFNGQIMKRGDEFTNIARVGCIRLTLALGIRRSMVYANSRGSRYM